MRKSCARAQRIVQKQPCSKTDKGQHWACGRGGIGIALIYALSPVDKKPQLCDSPFVQVCLHVGLDGGDLHDDPLLLAVTDVHQLLSCRLQILHFDVALLLGARQSVRDLCKPEKNE